MLYRGISMLGCLVAMAAGLVSAQMTTNPKAGYNVAGIIRDANDAPLAEAQISLSRDGEAARLFRTASDGKYTFESVAAGKIQLSVRRLGYHGSALTLDVGPEMPSTPFDFNLTEIRSDLADVVVEGSKGHLDEFYSHMANNTFAKFFGQREIERRHPAFLSELLRTVPGASLYASERSGNRVMLRDCKPMVWLDGMRAQGAELDEVVGPMDVAGLEVYPSSAGLPPQYQDRNNRMCGAIVVWTKNQ